MWCSTVCNIIAIHFIHCNATINNLNYVLQPDNMNDELCSKLLHSHTVTFSSASFPFVVQLTGRVRI